MHEYLRIHRQKQSSPRALSTRSSEAPQGDAQPLAPDLGNDFQADASSSPQHGHGIGRIAIRHSAQAGSLQAQLHISQPGDESEREADHIADQVMRMPEPGTVVRPTNEPSIQRMCTACQSEGMEEQKSIQRQAMDGTDMTGGEAERASGASHAGDRGDPPVLSQLAELRSQGGQQLPDATRAFMEQRFGHDFSGVRVHTGVQAARSAQSVSALAYTVGHDIVFGEGQYEPGADHGKRLLAHELTHVVQQESAPRMGLQRQTPDGAVSGTTAARPRPSLSELVTIANSAINAEYTSAARDGLADFENAMATTFDFGAFAVAQLGNLIWAAACFTTGTPAFLISLAGITTSANASSASTVTDRTTFHEEAIKRIDDLRTALLNEIPRVTADVDQQSTAGGWDDFRTRRELLLRLLRPEFIQTASGLPTVDRGAISRQIARDLTVRANAYQPTTIGSGGGRFIYDYSVNQHYAEQGVWPFDSTSLRPVTDWQFTRGQTEVYLTEGGDAALRILKTAPLILPADMPFAKSVYIHSSGTAGTLEIHLDAQNQITNVRGYDVFDNFGAPPQRLASRSPPSPADPIGAARNVIAQMWGTTGGRPPWVRPQDLSLAIFPFRSRATR